MGEQQGQIDGLGFCLGERGVILSVASAFARPVQGNAGRTKRGKGLPYVLGAERPNGARMKLSGHRLSLTLKRQGTQIE